MKRRLGKLVNEQQDNWDEDLEAILFGIRSSISQATKFTPFFLMFCREARQISDMVFADTECAATMPQRATEKQVQERMEFCQQIGQHVKVNIERAQAKMKKTYEARVSKGTKCFTFKVGDVVLVKNQRRAGRKGGKLEPDWKGPYTITEISESYAYVQNSQGKPLANKVSREHLKPFVNSAIPVQMLTPSVPSKEDSPTTVVEDPTELSILHETLPATRTVPFGLTASRKRRINSGGSSRVKRLRPLEKTTLVKYLPPTVYTTFLQPNYCLNDETIDYAQGLLSTQFPNIEGFQATVALAGSSVGGYIPTATDKFVQIVHINGNH